MENVEEQLLPPLSLRLAASLIYFLLILLAVMWFEFKSKLLRHDSFDALFAYIPAMFLASFLGYRFAGWYEIVDNENNLLEIIFAPVCIILGAALCWSFLFILVEDSAIHLGACLFGAIIALIMFLHFTWPILLVGGVVASLLTSSVAKRLKNNSGSLLKGASF